MTGTAAFELERFVWADGELEVAGRWRAGTPRRFRRIRLLLVRDGGRPRRLVPLSAAPLTATPGGAEWAASFPWPAQPETVARAELEVGRDLLVELPAPVRETRIGARAAAASAELEVPQGRRDGMAARLRSARDERDGIVSEIERLRDERARLVTEIEAVRNERDALWDELDAVRDRLERERSAPRVAVAAPGRPRAVRRPARPAGDRWTLAVAAGALALPVAAAAAVLLGSVR